MAVSHFPSPIPLLRAARGIAQADLASAAGVSTGALSNFERARRRPSSATCVRMAEALDCEVAAVEGGDFTVSYANGTVEIASPPTRRK